MLKIRLFFFSLLAINLTGVACINVPDFDAAPVNTQLTGYLITEKFWGNPGFGENPKTDKKFTAYLLKLDIPEVLCQPDISLHQIKTLDCIELINNGPISLDSSLGKHIIAYGSLFAAETGWHVSPILLNEKKFTIKETKASPRETIDFKNYRCQSTKWTGTKVNTI